MTIILYFLTLLLIANSKLPWRSYCHKGTRLLDYNIQEPLSVLPEILPIPEYSGC